jgi:uncharacterized Zn-finger protein
MASKTLRWILYGIAGVLIIFGFIWMIASVLDSMRIIIGSVFLLTAFLIIFLNREKKPKEIIREPQILGELKVKEIRCPNCGAVLDADAIHMHEDVPIAKCKYCGKSFGVTEEPTW